MKLDLAYHELCREFDKLDGLRRNMEGLHPRYQKLVAEIIMLRMYDVWIVSLESSVKRLLCCGAYLDGSEVGAVVRCLNLSMADRLIREYGRSKRMDYPLRWTRVKDVKDNVKFLVDGGSKFLARLDENVNLINDMRVVRNRIAHNNKDSRRLYQELVFRRYGGVRNAITPGVLLMSPGRSENLLSDYLAMSRLVIKLMIE